MLRALISLWLLFSAFPAWGHQAYRPASSCESIVTSFTGKDNHSVTPVTELSQETAPLFREKLPNGLWGIKGLTTRNFNAIHVWFWPSVDDDGRPTHVHHRDAAAAVLNKYAETLLDIASASAEFYSELWFSQAQVIAEFAARLGGIHSARQSRLLEIEHLTTIHGFQFAGTQNSRTGRFEVLYFDLDSSITAAQASAISDGRLEITEAWLFDLARQILAMHNHIPPSMRAYQTVRIRKCLFSLLTKQHRAFLNEQLRSAGLHIAKLAAP